MSSIEADGIYRLMNQQHAQNRNDIDALKSGQITLTSSMDKLVGEIGGATRVLKFIAWVIMAFIAALGVWFASLEARGKVAIEKPNAGVSYSQPQDSSLPPAYVKQ
jgi:hypothetical protein